MISSLEVRRVCAKVRRVTPQRSHFRRKLDLESPGDRGTSFTGRVSLKRQPWLKDHAVLDRVLLPGTAFAELLLAAGRELGCEAIEELTLEAPLLLFEGDDVDLQVVAGEDDGGGRREVEVYSRGPVDPDANGGGAEWVRHATGVLSDAGSRWA